MELGELREEEWDDLVDCLVQKRRKVSSAPVPQSLKNLASRAILKSYQRFSADGSFIIKIPLNYLPNSTVQNFLNIMKSAQESGEELLPDKAFGYEIVRRLMNKQITEVNLNEVNSWCETPISLADLKECRNIRSITLWADIYRLGQEQLHFLPHIQLKNWTDLQVLSMRGYICDDDIIKKIQESFPRLVVLEFSVSANILSMDCVDYLANLKNLRCLYIRATFNKDNSHPTEIIVHAAGQIPQLQYLQFEGAVKSSMFVEMFANLYPQKKLTIKHLFFNWDPFLHETKTLSTPSGIFNVENVTFEDGWPSNLLVEEMTFMGELPQQALQIFSKNVLHLKNICFSMTNLSAVYTLVDEFGPLITSLELNCIVFEDDENLNLLRILLACPHLETFTFHDSNAFDKVQDLGLAPLHFKNLRCLNFTSYLRYLYQIGNSPINGILKMFLLGSENCRKLLISTKQLNVVLELLNESPNSLDKLEEFELFPAKGVADGPEMLEMLPSILMVCQKLLVGSTCLKKITLTIWDDMTRTIDAIRKSYPLHQKLADAVQVKLNLSTISREDKLSNFAALTLDELRYYMFVTGANCSFLDSLIVLM